MLTPDELARIPLFSGLPPAELQRLVRSCADIHLGAGEFAVHEGGERALYAVLEGRIEVVKLFDGVERTLGWRLPGTIFGEVPITLGTAFPGGYRAAEPSRVFRIDVQQYYALASVSQDVVMKVSALARERLGGLQSIAAEPPKPRVTLIDHRWNAEGAGHPPLPRPQPDLVPVADARRAGIRRRLVGAAAGRGGTADAALRRWSRHGASGRAHRGRAARAADGAAFAGI